MSALFSWRRWLVAVAVATIVLVFALDLIFPPDLSRYQAQSLALTDSGGGLLHVSLTKDGMWRLGASADRVSPLYLKLLLATEDKRFYEHPGADPLALGRAAYQFLTRGHIVSGGSTLTMQTARLLTPHPHSWAGKLRDIARALQLEAHFSKSRILSIYLTLAPFGGNIEGVRAASLIYFQREPDALTPEQAALLVALPRAPAKLRPDRHPARAIAAAGRILRANQIAAAPWPDRIARNTLPAEAPHLAQRLVSAGYRGVTRTTLDGGIQPAIERLAADERPWLQKADMAVIVLRNSDRAVLAYLGGADYFGPGGMVDMVHARRSPGSALKPMIYAQAFDDGLARPDTLTDDTPIRIGGYAPRDFDREFHGRVTIREALQQSYNLPAVDLLRRINPSRFTALIAQSGARLALPKDSDPSLPIALGGAAISLQDLALLYAGLANGGRFGDPRLFQDQPIAAGRALITANSARWISQILQGAPMPDGVAPDPSRPIAYKTGTSYAFKDSWALGFTPGYTVGVWVGRVSGDGRPGFYGRNTAAPLLFRCFGLLPEERPAPEAASIPEAAPHLAAAEAPPPRILYPPADAALEIANNGGKIAAVALEAAGGTPPYRWAIDGVPMLKPSTGLTPVWTPAGPGFYRLSVMDGANRAASERVRIE